MDRKGWMVRIERIVGLKTFSCGAKPHYELQLGHITDITVTVFAVNPIDYPLIRDYVTEHARSSHYERYRIT
jgi:hypothetical protein